MKNLYVPPIYFGVEVKRKVLLKCQKRTHIKLFIYFNDFDTQAV